MVDPRELKNLIDEYLETQENTKEYTAKATMRRLATVELVAFLTYVKEKEKNAAR